MSLTAHDAWEPYTLRSAIAAILAGDADEAGALSEQHNLTEGRRHPAQDVPC